MKRVDIVGFGPGSFDGMTLQAQRAIEECDYVVGFATYNNILKKYYPDKKYISNEMGGETVRVRKAFELAKDDNYVCIVCSGDSQVYGLASLAYEIGEEYAEVEIITVPGVSAVFSGSAILGAVCGNDLCTISLSDYHTDWDNIIKRLKLAAEGDFIISLYNVRSNKRPDSLSKACDALMEVIDSSRVCGVAENIGREGESYSIISLSELRDYAANMFTTVFIGNSKTRIINGKMVTPRGYKID